MRKLTNKKEQRQLTFAIAGGDGRGQTGEGGGGGGEEGGGLHWFLLVALLLFVSFVLGRLWRCFAKGAPRGMHDVAAVVWVPFQNRTFRD